MKLLHVIASPRLQGSTTLRISDVLLDGLSERFPNTQVETLDLFQADLPAIAGDNIDAKYTLLSGMPIGREHAESWAQIEHEIERFRASDVYVISAPMWNFSVPYALKYYIDCLVQPGYLFRFTPEGSVQPLLEGKRMVVVGTSGSVYSEGSPYQPFDHFEPYLRSIFGFVGITDVTFVRAHGTDIPGMREPAVEAAIDQARAVVASDDWVRYADVAA